MSYSCFYRIGLTKSERANIFALLLLLGALTLFVSSCASPIGKYTPDPKVVAMSTDTYSEEEEDLSEKKKADKNIHVSNAINIINATPQDKDKPLHFRDIVVNYHEFSQSLVDALKQEYAKHNVKISPTAEKKIKIKIVDITMFTGGFNFTAEIITSVIFGNGGAEEIKVSRSSYASPLMINHFATKPLDSAYADTVHNIISNQKIQAYLNE